MNHKYVMYKSFSVWPSQDQIYFEHNELGDEYACCVFLDKSTGKIFDYDSCAVIPEEVGDWLKFHDFNVVQDKDGLWDIGYE